MTYKKIITGGSFGPGGSFDDRCYFENCTFTAAVKFGDHCDFVNCKFVKCCPKSYSNQSSTGKHCRFFKCKLESVKVGQYAELYDTNKSGYLVVVQGPLPNKNTKEQKGQENKVVSDSCCGQRLNSQEVKQGNAFNPCPDKDIEGYSDVPAKTRQKCCPENTR